MGPRPLLLHMNIRYTVIQQENLQDFEAQVNRWAAAGYTMVQFRMKKGLYVAVMALTPMPPPWGVGRKED